MKISIAAALSIVLFSNAALATTDVSPRTFAVMSLIGDSLTVVTAHPTTGSHLNTNDIQKFDDPSAALDLSALHAAEAAIKKLDPGAAPVLLATDSPVLRKLQGQLIDNQHLVDADGLLGELKNAGVTDFLLITKHRAPAALQAQNVTLGSGSLYGLGFYIDGDEIIKRSDTEQVAFGFLAPYAYFEIALIDVATLAVENEVDVTAGTVLSNARNKSDNNDPNPWNVLSSEEKAKALDRLVRSSIMDKVPGMISAKAPSIVHAGNPPAATTGDSAAPN